MNQIVHRTQWDPCHPAPRPHGPCSATRYRQHGAAAVTAPATIWTPAGAPTTTIKRVRGLSFAYVNSDRQVLCESCGAGIGLRTIPSECE